MAIFFTLFYRYPEWSDDANKEDEYIESLIELARRIQKGARIDFGIDAFYKVACLNPGSNVSYCSANSPHLMVIADVPEGEDEYEDTVVDFQKTCLAYMKDFAKNGERLLSWWRLFQDNPSVSF